MSATQHTPGPWVVRTIDGSLGTVETEDGKLQIGQTFQLHGSDRKTNHSERKANAHLFAAAPELLEALESALKTVEFEHHPFRPWHQQARAAIAKAKGEL